MKTFKSDLSGKEHPVSELISGKVIRTPIMELIRKDHPHFDHEGKLSVGEMNQYRQKYVSDCLAQEIGELDVLERTVVNSMNDDTMLTSKIEDDVQKLTFGQRIADKVAAFGGSWTFIISFGAFLFAWISLNVFWLNNRAFDPYPFILLNLILSTIAALQAPVIMMSQNRQEEKDRDRAKKDYMINLKSELEIRLLHEKLDHLIIRQQQDLLEVQREQIDMMSEIMKKVSK